ncbi:S8 family serine peptidase [Arthrobacter sp. B1I2]|uniref:S8 family serine peptidase n=1 Tax=Arthrobacter sp. B1I2 TaxID=3042263 RepID=UPI002785D58D|nr:S8 family serine peptidase [Arthrobacter sp. B1I2]MDQ0733059.1 thermitase [Arthrobacter sp. B1I2]
MKKLVLASFTALLMVIGTLLGAVAPGNAATDPSITAGQILVKFRDNAAAAGVLRPFGLSDGPGVGSTGAHLITVPAGKELQLVEALSRNPVVEYAEPDRVVTPASDDTYFSRQYALQNDGQSFTNNFSGQTTPEIDVAAGTKDADVDAVEAWAVTTGTGMRVAVLDSGVAMDNPDITPKVVARTNFTTSRSNDDNYGHGTHVAGIVAATANNGIGVAGVCPACSILAGKILSDTGMGSSSGLANGINWAVKNGAHVINMSLAVGASTTLETAVNNAWNAGVVLVAAAGNGGNTGMVYPGAYSHVIAVGATDNNDKKASFSTYGTWVDVAAPGVSVFSTFPNHRFTLAREYNRSQGYDIGSGTSMASPIVAAVAALARSAHPGFTNLDIRAKVESTTDTVGVIGTDWAHGRVNADRAVR